MVVSHKFRPPMAEGHGRELINTPVGLACERPLGSRRIIAIHATRRKCSGLMPSPEQGVCLQTPFLNESRPDHRNVRLGIAKRVRRRMDRVVAHDEIVLVRSGRAENELGIGQRFEFYRFARRLESREVPVRQFVRRRRKECAAKIRPNAIMSKNRRSMPSQCSYGGLWLLAPQLPRPPKSHFDPQACGPPNFYWSPKT
jgi:hypothetical protein